MRRLLFIFTLFISIVTNAQIVGRQTTDQYPITSWGTLTYGLTWLPNGYANTAVYNKTYPLIIFLHGAGEAGTTAAHLSRLLNNSIPKMISQGWNATVTNPLTNQPDSFIVVSPQAGGWSYNYASLKYILPNVLSRYRVDENRIYLTGLSAGGGGVFSVMGCNDSLFTRHFAAMATASTAETDGVNGYSYTQVEAQIRNVKRDSVHVWTVTGDQDYLLNAGIRYHDSTNKANPTIPNKLTNIATVGHSAWTKMYDTLFRPTVNYYGSTLNCSSGCPAQTAPNTNGSSVRGSGVTQDSLNVYEWFLLWSRTAGSLDPTANAGSDQSLSLGTTSTTLSGSGTGGDGSVSSYGWARVSGPNTPTIVSASSASTSVTGMIAGTYVFRLTVTNSLAETATDDITVTIAAGCGGTKRYVTPNSTSGGYNSFYSSSPGYNPGDTIVLQASYNPWGYFGFGSTNGTAGCPIVVINEGGQVQLKDGIAFESVQYVKVLGNLGGQQYGFKVESNLSNPNNVALGISKKSKNVEISHVYVTNAEYGCWIKNEAECDTTINYPNWWLDSISVHDCYFKGMDSQGFYMGSTDPNNLDRPISCDSSGFTVTKYYAPTRLRNIKIYNNIIDSTGRPGIQLSAGMEGTNEIYNNTISNVGTQYDDAQGAGISLGGYTRALVYGNRIKKTLTWGIVALGASGLSKIYDNVIDSSGRLGGTTLTWPANIHIDTRTTTPVDSTTFQIRNNVMNNPGSASYNITIADQRNTITNKNVICNNITFGNKPATISNSETLQSLNCNTAFHTLPSITLSGPDTITLPLDSITLNVTLVTTSDTAGRIYKWTKLKSPSATNKRITVIGSSTVEGYGVSATQNFVYLLKEHYKGLGLIDTIYNLGLGGTDPINYNYTTALNKGAEIFLMSFPTNGYDSYSISTILAEYREARDSCLGRGVEFFCTGTQPRNPYSDANRIKLNTINDSLRNIFGERFIDFNTFLLNKDGNLMKTAYDQGDGFHINASGHAQLAELVIAANMFQAFATGSTVSSHSAIVDSTLATDNAVGTHLYQLSVWDTYGVGNSEVYQLVQEDVPGDPGEPYKGFKLRGRRIKF